ncbi:hypothetical protein BSKO_05110 [Bryopsis sp. KO-2023]|nr:hypothetical protein BSKO_05110 [Bryopsis sp. KO-2023]
MLVVLKTEGGNSNIDPEIRDVENRFSFIFSDIVGMSWTKKVLQDEFFLKAKKAGYVSRAAFKLKQIQTKHKIIPPGGKVLDLGCAPGAWLQVACQEIRNKNKGGLVLGIDIQDVSVPVRFCDKRVSVLKADAMALTPKLLRTYSEEGFDVVLSDMMDSTTGHSDIDVVRSMELAGTAFQLATGRHPDMEDEKLHDGVLVDGGNLVMKIFEGAGIQEFVAYTRPFFTKVSRVRPDATRKISREFYLVCKGRKPSKC